MNFVSVIIATKNREAILLETLQKAEFAIEANMAEIIVINDGESLNFSTHFSKAISVYSNPGNGVSVARNFGVKKAKGNILFFIDDDMWINKEAMHWIFNNFSEKENEEKVFNLNWVYPDSLLPALQNTKIGQYLLATNYNTMWGRMQVSDIEPVNGWYPFKMIMSGSLVMTKNLFNTIGGYYEKMIFQGEDNDLANKINALQIPIFCVFDVKLHHNQKDRLQTELYFKRVANGFNSQFKAIQAGLISPWGRSDYGPVSEFVFSIFVATENFWLGILAITPTKGFSKINNTLIGKLSGLQRFKSWKRYNKNLKSE